MNDTMSKTYPDGMLLLLLLLLWLVCRFVS
jgi:hypothetical protein